MTVHGWLALGKQIDEPDVEWLAGQFDEYQIDTEMTDPNREGRYLVCGGSRLYMDLEPEGPWSTMKPGAVEVQLEALKLSTKRLQRAKLCSRVVFDFVGDEADQTLGWGQYALDAGWPNAVILATHDSSGTRITAWHPYRIEL